MVRGPLYDLHHDLGARSVDFGGWEMPLQYEGVLVEHLAVREDVGVFDVSHLGRFRLEGTGSTQMLRRLLCNDITAVEPGRAQYTMLLNEAGGVEDDIIVWRWEEEEYWVLPNGVNHERVMAVVASRAGAGVRVEDLRGTTAFLAVQGPRAPEVLEAVLDWRVRRFRLQRLEEDGLATWAAGTGYTGEAGGEVAVPLERAPGLFRKLVEAGARPCGLGARDTLRLEMGYPLWGEDLDPDTTPLEAGLEWVVRWDHDFVGRPALEGQRREGLRKRRVGLVMEGREIPRHGYAVRAGESLGEVASGNYSPLLKRGIGLAYLTPPPPDELERLEVEVRRRWAGARAVEPPFVRRDG